jgi:ParB-like chromosome segregation protein Spo0J
MTTKTHNPADKVERWDITRLTPYARNSRTHSDEQISQLAASIKEWGWTTPVLVDEDGSIIAGHGRTLAAQRLKMTEVPVMVAKGWSDAKKRAYVIADNKLALNAGWDNELLRLELSEIGEMGFDLDLTGFAAEEIKALQFDDDAEAEMPELKDGDKEPFQQKTFTLHDDQAEVVDNAITLARTNPLADTGLNENTNGNALALICHQWLEARNGKR